MISVSLLRVACLVVVLTSASSAQAERAQFSADVCIEGSASLLCARDLSTLPTRDVPSLSSRDLPSLSRDSEHLFTPGAPLASLAHYPPNATEINDLDFVLNGSGAPGVYNSSQSPDYGVYNWCNMPHVRAAEYV